MAHCGDKKCQVVFEDTRLDVNTVQAYPPRCPYFLAEAAPYYVPQDSLLIEVLRSGEKEIASWRYPVFVVSPALPLPQSGTTVDAGCLDELAQNVRMVLISAYDQESYVIWQRQE